MPSYVVRLRYIVDVDVDIEADSEDEAREIAERMHESGEIDTNEGSFSLDDISVNGVY